MINNKFNRKFRRLLSISCLGAIAFSQVINASDVSTLLSMTQTFRDTLMCTIEKQLKDNAWKPNFNLRVENGGNNEERKNIMYIIKTRVGIFGKIKYMRLEYSDEYVTTLKDIILWREPKEKKVLILPGSKEMEEFIGCLDNDPVGFLRETKTLNEIEEIAWSRGCSGLKAEIDKAKKERKNKDKEEEEKRKHEEEEEIKRISQRNTLAFIGVAGFAALTSAVIEIGNL